MVATSLQHPSSEKSTNVRVHSEPWQLRIIRAGFGLLGRWAPALASRLAFRLFTSPRRFQRPQREVMWLAGARRETLAVGEREIVVHRWGAGRPVLLVHGWEGRGSQMGAIARALASRGYEAVALDAVGHGESSGRRANMLDFIEIIAALGERLGPLAAVVGHSMGGAAVTLSVADGLDVERVVVIAAPDHMRRVLSNFASMLGLPLAVREGMEEILRQRFGASAEEHFSPVVRSRQLGQPVLVVHDVEDRDVAFAAGRELSAAWPDARLHATEGLGHTRILRDPDVTTSITQFVQEV